MADALIPTRLVSQNLPSSSCAWSLNPRVAYLALNFDAGWSWSASEDVGGCQGRMAGFTAMDNLAFWQLVDRARSQVGDVSDSDALAERCSALLATHPTAEILAAQQIFWDLMADSRRYDLWAAAYLINGGCSDDGFEYFRGWLVMQGRAVFEAALADPDSLADLPVVRAAADDGTEFECENALGIAHDAYRTATGEDMPQDAWTIRYGDPGDGSAFEDEVMARRLPRLVALFTA